MDSTNLPSSFGDNSDFYEESRLQKLSRRIKQEPLIPFGCLLTCYALWQAQKSIKRGDHYRTQRMFRARIYAQGFTIVAMVVGSIYYQKDRDKRKEYDLLVAQKKAESKRDAWIRELEARDEEDKLAKAKRDAARELMRKERDREKAASEGPGFAETRSVLEDKDRRDLGIMKAVRELRW